MGNLPDICAGLDRAVQLTANALGELFGFARLKRASGEA
jgi:hypothetical protein